jgi:two-component system sensor histidine kinase DegS
MLDDLGLLPALAWLFKRYSAQTNVRVRFEHAGIEPRLDPKFATAVFRVVPEALTIVARLAGVRKATVHLWTNRDGLYVYVQDQGVGFEPAAAQAPGHGSGLTGMHERVRLLGGHLAVESAPGKGALVTTRFPWTGRTRTSQTTDRTET